MTTGREDTLRARLQQVTEAEDWQEYLALLEAVIRDLPNGIVLLDSLAPIQRYTCLVHVFEFTEMPEYIAIAGRPFSKVFASPRFAHWLLEKSLLTEVSEPDAHEGDLVFYFDQAGRIKHAGLSRGAGRVESKWGRGGLFQHGIFEVPQSYGTSVKFFRRISYEEALGYFKRYAKEKGILFLD